MDVKNKARIGAQDAETPRAHLTLTLNTLTFTVCFAAWMLNGVLVTFLVDNQVFDWSASQMGWLIGTPVLTGSLMNYAVPRAADMPALIL